MATVIHNLSATTVIGFFWGSVIFMLLSRVWFRHTQNTAYYTWHADDAPPGQNRIDRGVDGCLNMFVDLAIAIMLVLALLGTAKELLQL